MKNPSRFPKAKPTANQRHGKVFDGALPQTPRNAKKSANQLASSLSPDSWAELMATDKRRRGIDPNKLVFIGIHNVAQYWWCAQYSVLKSQENELTFFQTYLRDRVNYSLQLNLIRQPPERFEEWLTVGSDLTNAHLVPLLNLDRRRSAAAEAPTTPAIACAVENGVSYLHPGLDGVERQMHVDHALALGLRIAEPGDRVPQMLRGKMAEAAFAKSYPRLRWNWSWNRYIVVGAPDGLTDEFVYEFKSVQTLGKMRFARPVAFAQADLYGFFWQRSQKHVDFYGEKENRMETVRSPVDAARATETLEKFEAVDHGGVPRRPVEWKCRDCECRPSCPLWL